MADTKIVPGTRPASSYTNKEAGYTTKGNAERTRRTDNKKTFGERNKTYFNNLAAEVLGDRDYDMSNYSDDELDKMIKKNPSSQEGILAQKERNRRDEEAGMATKEVNVTNAKGGKDDMRFSSGSTLEDAKTFGDTKAKDVPAKLRAMGKDPNTTSREEAAALTRTDKSTPNTSAGSAGAKSTTPSTSDKPTDSEPFPAGISTDEPSEDVSIKSEEDVKKKVENPPTKADEVRKFGKDLSKFVIQSYLRGDFGKKSDPNAIASMGYYLLDKIGSALVNASQVARGQTPTAKSQWSKLLEQQTDLLGKGMTAEWFNGLTPEQQAALLKTGGIQGTTATALNENVSDTSDKTREMDMEKKTLEIKKLNQDQKNTAQNNLNALITRKSELQALISKLKSDQGWGSYVEAMNAVVGTAKGLETVGATSSTSSSDSSNKGSSNTLGGNIGTGSVPSAFVSANIGDSQTWNSSSASSNSRNAGSSLNKDSLALSKFKDAEGYAKAGKEAQKEANKQLISQLEDQIKVIDNCIASWGKDLGINK